MDPAASGQSGQINGTSHPKAPQPLRKVPPHLLRRKQRTADPLVARKKPQQRPPAAPGASVLSSANRSGVVSLSLPPEARPLKVFNGEDEAKRLAAFDGQRKLNGGWTDPPPASGSGYRDFPVVTTKRALREGIRYHVMRFAKAGKGGDDEREIDPTNQDDFTRPVSLHRRDPRQPAPGRAVKEEAPPPPTPPTADDKEAEKVAQQKADREAQRAIDMAQIAPVAKDSNPKKPAQNQKKEKQFQLYFPKNTAEQRKETEIRYEEALPWHLEDADGKNVWVGTYVSALSEANVALVISGSAFRMVPLEKFYRFTPKPPFQAYSIEKAEEIMGKKMSVGRWAMRDTEKKKFEEELEETRKTIGGRARVKLESSTFRSAPRSEKIDHDDIDMEGDEFQDDDENVGLEPENDEDSKDSRERLRRNHLGANLFGNADEQEVDKEEQENKAARKTGQLGKQLRKALAKREDHLEYLEYVDSDTNSEKEDFLELSSDDEDNDEPDNEKKDDETKSKSDAKEKPPTSTNTPKTNTTPSGKQKATDALKKSKSLKRPGSPNLSESSETESSRKKMKKHATGSVRPSRSTTPLPGQPKTKGPKGGALSDGEATGGEMSDGPAGGKRRIKIVGSGAKGTPSGSRATSPAPAASSQGQLSPGSNPGSPVRAGSPNSRATSPTGGNAMVDAAEIVSTLLQIPEGITVGALLRRFGNRIGDGPNQMKRKDWIKLVKENSVFGEDKLLRARVPGSSSP
ncbi:transcription initiation factor iif subunit [Niveomyces insectorum RCEF 264]|uniref:Transcription initiation factor iif subunit n=1 Tax=Niveomyces insectorum RCEF 264 TaxID=1081102 RepID=A0A168A9B3_9HYPO|nr:transcription initiation factor iif subunit [Niveomyces insectorum RCEF 264]